jgi:hypothetical protein
MTCETRVSEMQAERAASFSGATIQLGEIELDR